MRGATSFHRQLVWSLLVGLAAAGCATSEDDDLGGSLPASGPLEGKADEDDPRDAQPGLYGFTDPPGDVIGLGAEFEPVRELFVSWPLNSYGEEDVNVTETVYKILKAAIPHTEITIVVQEDALEMLKERLRSKRVPMSTLNYATVRVQSAWMRDFGPMLVRSSGDDERVIDTRYYPNRLHDDAVPTRLAPGWGWQVARPPLAFEGGNLLSDGQGLCVTSDRTKAANPGRNIPTLMKQYFGCTRTVIVPKLTGFETTGHIDMFMMLTDVDKALVGEIIDPENTYDHTNASRLDETAEILTAEGFEVTRMPMPPADVGGFRSYLNAVPLNGIVLMPVFTNEREHEARAIQIMREAFPGREIVTIDSTTVTRLGGALHCMTMTHAAEPL